MPIPRAVLTNALSRYALNCVPCAQRRPIPLGMELGELTSDPADTKNAFDGRRGGHGDPFPHQKGKDADDAQVCPQIQDPDPPSRAGTDSANLSLCQRIDLFDDGRCRAEYKA